LRCAARWQEVARIYVLILGTVVLSACNSDSDDPGAVMDSASAGTGTRAIQISPGTTPAFDLSIHDYVVDCSTTPRAGPGFARRLVRVYRFGAPAAGRRPAGPVGRRILLDRVGPGRQSGTHHQLQPANGVFLPSRSRAPWSRHGRHAAQRHGRHEPPVRTRTQAKWAGALASRTSGIRSRNRLWNSNMQFSSVDSGPGS
jgi:hypothetical protein